MNLIEQLGLENAKTLDGMLHKHGVTESWKIAVINGMWQRSSVGFTHGELRTAIACHATLTNKDSTYKEQTIDTIYLCTIVDGLILNDSCVITVTFTGSTSVVLIGSSKQMVINRVGDVINLLFNNESYSLKKDQIEAALRPYLGSRTLIQAFG